MENGLKLKIIEEMRALGDKFSLLAREEKSAERAKTSFYMAMKAYELALKTEKEMNIELRKNSKPVLNQKFLNEIVCTVNRSLIWSMYQDFCDRHEIDPLKKGELFTKLSENGFKFKKTNGEWLAIPPKGGIKLLD